MAYRFYPMTHTKKVIPAPAPALDTKSAAAFPALGLGSGSAAKPVIVKAAMDFKKMALAPSASVPAIYKIEPKKIMVKPSSSVVTHCYDELGEDYDGPDEWEEQKVRDEYELNANLPVGGRRGGF